MEIYWTESKSFREKWLAGVDEKCKRCYTPLCLKEKAICCFSCYLNCENWRENPLENCCMCACNPLLLTMHPKYASCFCEHHVLTWGERLEVNVDTSRMGHFASLSVALIKKILLLLDPVDIASFALAIPDSLSIIESILFLRDNIKRYSPLRKKNRALRQLCILYSISGFKSRKHWCSTSRTQNWCLKSRTKSGHCLNCLLNPGCLTIPPEQAECFCIDHWNLHCKGKILWETDSQDSLEEDG
ncbi:protein RH [Lizard adenovirus 2]|uniref:Protein RH n=1 Tax=Lizard adenovirus 2 TaxID=874272 RepID=A0A076FTG9_9ADEN|nr:protein RH [Lizard adenovirus 2]AII22585.1 protein RH [Lizard adenovirus 2]